jgi:hypothetical protein
MARTRVLLVSSRDLEFSGFQLVKGQYEAIVPTESGWLWSDPLGLYSGIYERQLRWFSAEGQLIPLPEEHERRAKKQAQQEAAQAQQRIERLEELLRSQGIDPNQRPDS